MEGGLEPGCEQVSTTCLGTPGCGSTLEVHLGQKRNSEKMSETTSKMCVCVRFGMLKDISLTPVLMKIAHDVTATQSCILSKKHLLKVKIRVDE